MTIFADRSYRGQNVMSHIVSPVLENGRVKPFQRRKPGMVVQVETTRFLWGRNNPVNLFRGVVTEITEGFVKVRVCCGPTENIPVVTINGHKYQAGSSAIPGKYMFVRVPRQYVKLVHPDSLGDTFRMYAAWNLERCINDSLVNWKEKLYGKMAQYALENRMRTVYFRKGHDVGSLVGRKENQTSDRRNPALWKPQEQEGTNTRRLFERLQAAREGRNTVHAAFRPLMDNVASSVLMRRMARWNNKMTKLGDYEHTVTRQGCGHYEFKNRMVMLHNSYGGETHCAACAENVTIITLLNEDGDEVRCNADNTRAYTWEDGTQRMTEPEGVIGNYHSSKRKCGLLPNLDGTPYHGLTLGMELEMELANREDDDREELARKLMGRIHRARPEAWGKAVAGSKPGYGYIENDGSLDCGFELVTSWGSLDVHREMVLRIFGPDAGRKDLPFRGELRSHDVNTCGLHVHLAKPTSLLHAVKLQAFYNDPANEKLIHAVARRYGTSYAKAQRSKSKENVNRNTKEMLNGYSLRKTWLERHGYERQQVIRNAMSRLTESRYEQVNFSPERTVEIRVFKGSLLPTTIIACLEFAYAAYQYTKEAKAPDLTTTAFLEWISEPKRRRDTRYLRAYLAAKGFKVFMPRVHAKAVVMDTEENRQTAGAI